MRDEIKSPDQGEASQATEATEGKFSPNQSDVKDFSVKSAGEEKGGEEEKLDETGMVKVYKYMGEELTVQEGLVKKQTLGRLTQKNGWILHLSRVMRKPVFGVSEQVQHRPVCTATEDG